MTDIVQWIAIGLVAGSVLALGLAQLELWHQGRRFARRAGEELRKHRTEEHRS